MHAYSYDGCDSDSLGSDPLSGSDSEASRADSQQSLVILLDDDDDELEEQVHPLPSHRPKRPLPRNFRRSYDSPVKEEKTRRMETPTPEVYHTISCAPGVRDKSLEVRVLLCAAPSQLKLRSRNFGSSAIDSARSPRENPPSQ